MSAFEEAWVLLKGNPDARVQVRNAADNSYSARDFPIHPAALGAANRQTMAVDENRRKLFNFARIQGQELSNDRLNEVARQMVTPEQRGRIKNTSFDLKYKHPDFVHRTRSATNIPRTEGEERERKRAMEAARVRRYERGRAGDGKPLRLASKKERSRARGKGFQVGRGEE